MSSNNRAKRGSSGSPNSRKKTKSPARVQQLQPIDIQQLPSPADMFAIEAQAQSLLETPSRVYMPHEGYEQTQLVDTMPLKPHTASGVSQGQRMGQMNIATNSKQNSPGSNGPKTLLASAYRAGETATDGMNKLLGGPTLVPNFRSISPSIFNIDLNRTAGGRAVPDGLGSNSPNEPYQQNNQNQIYVSIHSKQNDGGMTGSMSSNRGPQAHFDANQSRRVKRIGPINKGDKIKFGVLVQEQAKRKNSVSNIDQLEPHEIFETPQQLMQQGRVAIGKHSEAVNRIVDMHGTYTTTKTLPTVLISKHTNIIKQFRKNFTRETDAYSKHKMNSTMMSQNSQMGPGMSTTVGGGYYTESEAIKSKIQGLRQQTSAASRMSKRTYWSDDGALMNIRDVIEEHAKSVAALNKSFRPNMHLEIDEKRKRRNKELEEKGRKIAEKLNLSVHSCCTKASRMYRCLTDEQPIRRHNKPLTHLMRPSEKMMLEKKQQEEDERRKKKIEEKQQMKRKMLSLTMSALSNQFKGGFNSAARGSRPDKETQKRIKNEVKAYKKRMRPKNNREDWEQQRKDVEESIDQGQTFSHLSRSYPMKREWSKYLVLLRKKEKDRRKKELKIREIVEDLNERGVVDDKVVTKELEMFEYLEYKKIRDKTKARMGAKAEAKYYRPVDTDRTLVVQPISLDMSDEYDDGPGGFKLDDFQGIETMFSKQSLEQRQLRVDRARERLREKRLQRIEQEKLQQAADLEDLQSQYAPQRHASGFSITEAKRTQSSILEQVSKSNETNEAILLAKQKEGVPNINFNDQHVQLVSKDRYVQLLKSKNKQQRQAKKQQTQSPYQSLPSRPKELDDSIEVDKTNKGEQLDQQSVFSKPDADQATDQDFMSSDKKAAIRVEIASSGGIRNIKNETIKTVSQVRDYSLEDGGIFEKKTVIANTSIEEAKLGESLTQRSLEFVANNSGSNLGEDFQETRSQRGLVTNGTHKQPFESIQESQGHRTQETAMRMAQTQPEDGQIDKDTEMLDATEANNSMQQDEVAALPNEIKGIANMTQQMPRVRPSTTENIRRNIMKNRRRQLMSGYNNNATKFDHLRGSAPDAAGVTQRFGQYINNQTQKSAGMITTVQQHQQQQRQGMINQHSSDQRQFLPTALANTASSAFVTDTRPSNGQLNNSGGGYGTRMDFHGGVVNLTSSPDQQQRGFSSGHQGGSMTVSGLTQAPTMEDWRSENKVVIWKEMVRYKEENKVTGGKRIDRQMIKSIRNRIRKERRKVLKRKSTQMFKSHGYATQSELVNANEIRSTSYGLSNTQLQQTAPFQPVQQMDQHPTITTEGQQSTLSPGHTSLEPINQNQVQMRSRFGNAQITGNTNIQRLSIDQQLLTHGRQSLQQYATQQVQSGHIRQTQQLSPGGTGTETEEPTTSDNNHTRDQRSPDGLTMTNAEMLSHDNQLNPYPDSANMNGTFMLGPFPGKQNNHLNSMHSMVDSDQHVRKDFLELNRTRVRENSLKNRLTSHMSRIRQMRNMRRNESLYQTRLSENMTKSSLNFNQKIQLGIKNRMKNYPISLQRLKSTAKAYSRGNFGSSMSTSMMYPGFQEQLQDRRSMKVFKTNEPVIDPDIVNRFTRNEAWNSTLNCPYFGLMSLRKTQERPINSESRQENILKPFTLGNKRDRTHIRKVKSAIKHRNKLREMDEKIYNLIDLCQKSNKIEWKNIYDENEEFRNTQKKKMQETKPVTLDDLVELTQI